MKWSSEYNLHIHTVLHLNKGDNNTRGHIGTELNNKEETVLQTTKSSKDVDISEVKAIHIRDKDFQPFAFRVNDDALPEVVTGYVFEQPKQDRSFPLTELTELQHRQALEKGFGKQVIQGYDKIIEALTDGYASIGFDRGRNVLVKLNTFLKYKRMIVKREKGIDIILISTIKTGLVRFGCIYRGINYAFLKVWFTSGAYIHELNYFSLDTV